jgi:hypothetical protein
MSTANAPQEERTEGTRSACGALVRGRRFKLAALTLVIVSGLTATGMYLFRPAPIPAPPHLPPTAVGLTMPMAIDAKFAAWDRPDVVFLLSGSQHGYLMPCGCSIPQKGGLERRYNFLRLLKGYGWPVVALDAGDIAQKEGIHVGANFRLLNLQAKDKYVTSMQALQRMGYTAVGIGEYESALGLSTVLGNFALNAERPRVLIANLKDADNRFPGQTKSWVEALEVDAATPGALPFKVGVAGVVGKETAKRILQRRERDVEFVGPKGEPGTTTTIKRVLGEMKEKKIELPVLIYQGLFNSGMPDKATEAVACAEAFTDIQIVLALSDVDEPPGQPVWVGNDAGHQRPVVHLGHKAKYVGVLGVWRTGNPNRPFTFKYELVELGEDLKTPPSHVKGHPIIDLLEDYTAKLKKENVLEEYSKAQTPHPLQVMPEVKGLKKPGEVTYVGSAACERCHATAYAKWKDTPHSHAYKTLVEVAKAPSNRQFDGECIVCHTVGFGYRGGYRSTIATPKLKDVGCESCHGPGSLHVANKDDKEWQRRMSLGWLKGTMDEKRRKEKIAEFCQKCHDSENDVNWVSGSFEMKWPLIVHYKEGEGP